MSLSAALALAAQGFHVFPLIAGGKIPAGSDFAGNSTRDPARLRAMFFDDLFSRDHGYNVGIYTGKFGDDPDESLCVIDIDNKDNRNGSQKLGALVADGTLPLSSTYTQQTPTGGFHLVYRTRAPVANSVGGVGRTRFPEGLDVRGRGGFIVGAGSTTDKGVYLAHAGPVAVAPDALIAFCTPWQAPRVEVNTDSVDGVNAERAAQRAIEYLMTTAPLAVEGSGGDATTFQVCARLKDFGVSEAVALEILLDVWNPRCAPPWDDNDLARKIANAFRFGRSAPGSAAPERLFKPAADTPAAQAPMARPEGFDEALMAASCHPLDQLNEEYACVLLGSSDSIMRQTTDAKGRPRTLYMSEQTFIRYLAGRTAKITIKKKPKKAGEEWTEEEVVVPLAETWLRLPGSAEPPLGGGRWRRQYEGVWFTPEQPSPPGWFNVWRGFRYLPPAAGSTVPAEWIWALEAWKDHLYTNVCRGDPHLAQWLTGWFAHLVQRPWEKPLTALCIRGRQGTGKTAFVKRVGDLFGEHCVVGAKPRFLTGQFNAHLEGCVLLVLEEAIWAGDQTAKAVAKELVTGDEHQIERKGKEMYPVPNYTRVISLSNEHWVMDVDADDRRYAFFTIGDNRRLDNQFFERMRIAMRAGGAGLLLDYLRRFDLSTVDVNTAPMTAGKLEQKIESLSPFQAYWLNCLQEGTIIDAAVDFTPGTWPQKVSKAALRTGLSEWCRKHSVRGRLPADNGIATLFHACCPSVDTGRFPNNGPTCFVLPPLAAARREWEDYMQHPITWSPV